MIRVEVYTSANKRTKSGRPQRWRWRAVNTGNGRKLATGGEAYSNQDDCLAAVRELFVDAKVVLRVDGAEATDLR